MNTASFYSSSPIMNAEQEAARYNASLVYHKTFTRAIFHTAKDASDFKRWLLAHEHHYYPVENSYVVVDYYR